MTVQASTIGIHVPEAGALAAAFDLLRRNEQDGIAVSLDQLGDIMLPPAVAGSAIDQAHIRGIASLYLAAELEAATLLPAAETLVGLAMDGGLPGALQGAVINRIATFWRERHHRTSPEERRAIFAHLFGMNLASAAGGVETTQAGAPNDEFEALFLDLCEALYKLDQNVANAAFGEADHQVRIRTTAEQLTESLLQHSNGTLQYLSSDILTTIGEVLKLFQSPELQAVFGVRNAWDLVHEIAQRYLHANPDIQTRLTRGTAGMLVLSWLADALPALGGGAPNLATLSDPVIVAATQWIEASLSLSEHAEAPPAGHA
jgi:hypothetical protein